MLIRLVVLSAVFVFASNVLHALDKIHVKAGDSFVIDKRYAQLRLKQLIVEDKATLKIAPGITTWAVEAEEVEIGFGVRVMGDGSDGANGLDGGSVADARSCNLAQPGRRGTDGSAGRGGVDVRWAVGVKSIGSIVFDLTGGNGGNGGNGGDGQNMPNLSGCSEPGGDAGDGGNGGNGGSGGSLNFHYWSLDPKLTDLSTNIQVKVNGGRAGKAGGAGFPGVGAEGRFESRKTLTNSRVWVAGGGEGQPGTDGAPGRAGRNGGLDIRLINQGSPDSVAVVEYPEPEAEVSDAEQTLLQRIEELELLTEKLDARVRLLELDKR